MKHSAPYFFINFHNTMECPICFDSVNASTGSTALSCGHTFHFTCIASWLSTTSSCPCCRKVPGLMESLSYSQAERELDIATTALEILENEKNRLEQFMIKQFPYDARKYYAFSKVLEKAVPDVFNVCYAESSNGDQIRFDAFLPDRICISETYAENPAFEPLFKEFMMTYAPIMFLHSRKRNTCSILELDQINKIQYIARTAAEKAKTRAS